MQQGFSRVLFCVSGVCSLTGIGKVRRERYLQYMTGQMYKCRFSLRKNVLKKAHNLQAYIIFF